MSKILFTNLETVDQAILLNIKSDRTLYDTCELSKYARSLCNNDFWQKRLLEKYGVVISDQDAQDAKNTDYRKLYRQLSSKNKNELLQWAAENGQVGLVTKMIKSGAKDPFQTALKKAATKVDDNPNYLQIVKELLYSYGRHLPLSILEDLLFTAINKNSLNLVKYLVKNGVLFDQSTIRNAQKKGRDEIANYLREHLK